MNGNVSIYYDNGKIEWDGNYIGNDPVLLEIEENANLIENLIKKI